MPSVFSHNPEATQIHDKNLTHQMRLVLLVLGTRISTDTTVKRKGTTSPQFSISPTEKVWGGENPVCCPLSHTAWPPCP